ncbi:MAG: hypothetical protein WEB79_08465 [Thermoleophilaceae bacterium]
MADDVTITLPPEQADVMAREVAYKATQVREAIGPEYDDPQGLLQLVEALQPLADEARRLLNGEPVADLGLLRELAQAVIADPGDELRDPALAQAVLDRLGAEEVVA